jgi:EmrB/QacA subfamily drug resistance transporter
MTMTAELPAMTTVRDDVQNDRSRWKALIVLCVGMLMIILDSTVVNVALPTIQRDLGFTPASLAWVMNGYLIAFGGLLLLAGRLGDLLSRRRVFLAGLTVFTLASLVCGFSVSQAMLIAARFVQGVGGALTSAVILGMIVTMFPKQREQAKAIGFYAFVSSAGGAVGLLAGGLITQALNWHWIFFINVPIGIATGIASLRLLRKDRGQGFGKGTDVLGAALITGALMLGVYTIVNPAAQYGWTATGTLTLGGISVALLIAFVIREATASTPLMPLRIFRSRTVTGANVVTVLTVAGMFGMFYLGVLYLQRVLGYDALATGLAFLPTTIVMAALSVRYSEKLITRFGNRAPLLPGLLLVAAGLALFARAPLAGNYLTDVLPSTILIGAGVGIAFPALTGLAMSGATDEDAGLASGLMNTMMQVGAALGLAVLATLSAARTGSLTAQGESARAALAHGYQLGFLIAAGSIVAAIAVAIPVFLIRYHQNPSE